MIEKQVETLLDELVDGRVFLDGVPDGTKRPCIVLQQVGGDPIEFLEGASGQDFIRLQVDVQADKRTEANSVMSVVRDKMKSLQASPVGAPVSLHEPIVGIYRRVCDFRVVGSS